MDVSLEHEIKRVQLHEMMEVIRFSITVTIIVSSIVTFVLWKHVNQSYISWWYGANILLSFIRYGIYFMYKMMDWTKHDIIAFSRCNMIAIGLSGLLLSLSIILFLPDMSFEHQLLLYLTLIAMMVGAVGTYSMQLEAFFIYTVPIAIAIFYKLVTTESLMLLSVLSLLFFFGTFTSVRRINYYVTSHLRTTMENRELISELAAAKESAESANNAKSMFLANMSHELRTPLNAVLGFSQMMRQTPSRSSEDRQNLDIINRSGEHLLHLINDVLDMSKIEAGHMVLEVENFDLRTLVHDVIDMMRIRAKAKGVELNYEQSAAEPYYIVGDASKLRQILINLLSNAVKFTDEGSITLRINLQSDDANRIKLQGEVQDSGIGIKPKDIERIFQPFTQLIESPEQKGSGLGLAIARKFVELMGGELIIESTPGKGSLFRFSVYVQPGIEEVVKERELGTLHVAGLKPSDTKWRILVAEDQLENQLLLKRLLEHIGFQVRLAENGLKSIELFKSWHPHFIWMDIHMPVMDGLEAIREIRNLPGGGEVKIAALTAGVFKEQESLATEAGADDFIRKPYASEMIFECMARHLDIEYIYYKDENITSTEQTLRPGTSEILMRLPKEMLMALESAVKALDIEYTQEVIDKIKEVNPELADGLQKLLNNLNFDRLKTIVMRRKDI